MSAYALHVVLSERTPTRTGTLPSGKRNPTMAGLNKAKHSSYLAYPGKKDFKNSDSGDIMFITSTKGQNVAGFKKGMRAELKRQVWNPLHIFWGRNLPFKKGKIL